MTGDINLNGHSVRHTNPAPIHEDEVVPKQCIENNFLNRFSPASTMARDLNMIGHHVSYLRAPEQNHHAATKDTQIRSCRFWVGTCREGLVWVETGFHIWASLNRTTTQSDFVL